MKRTELPKPLPFLGYDPEPPLDIDTSEIPGYDLERWRTREVRLTQREVAQLLPICDTCWCVWESDEVPSAAWRALLREWALAGRWQVSDDKLDPGKMRSLATVFGYATIADALDVSVSTARKWGAEGASQGDASPRNGAAPLLRWLFNDLDLEPIARVPVRIQCGSGKLESWEVQDIRSRTQETNAELADEFGVSISAIRKARNGRSYQWVGGGADE